MNIIRYIAAGILGLFVYGIFVLMFLGLLLSLTVPATIALILAFVIAALLLGSMGVVVWWVL